MWLFTKKKVEVSEQLIFLQSNNEWLFYFFWERSLQASEETDYKILFAFMIGLGSYLFLNCTMYIIKDFFLRKLWNLKKKKNTLKELKNQLHFRLKSWVNTSPVTCLPPLKEVQWEMRISIYSWERKVNTHRFVLSLWSWRTNQFVFCSKGKQ